MSYTGSQQQYGLGDLQHLQQQLMVARLQELQRQQQLGQFGDAKPSGSVNNLSAFVKHAAGGQIPKLSGPLSASKMVNHNWMHHNVSSSMPGITRGSTNSPSEGLRVNPALQQSEISLYGAPVSSGRGDLGQYSPVQVASYSSVSWLSANSDDKPVSQLPVLNNSYGNQASFQMLNRGFSLQSSPQVKPLPSEYNRTGDQTKDSQITATLDPLEEKILFDTDSGWDSSLSKLAGIDTAEYADGSSCKEYMDSFSSIQSGSWSALMQSAVAEVSSSDTGMQEELSGLSFQNTDSSIGKQPSNNLNALVSSVDSTVSSLFPCCTYSLNKYMCKACV